jgi:hypothetical protein
LSKADTREAEQRSNVLDAIARLELSKMTDPATAAAPSWLYELLPKRMETPPARELTPPANPERNTLAVQLTKILPKSSIREKHHKCYAISEDIPLKKNVDD